MTDDPLCPPQCPLCLRPIPPDVPQSLHHLVPRLKGGMGGPVVLLHHICHKKVRARFSKAELARDFATVAALRGADGLRGFLDWGTRRRQVASSMRDLGEDKSKTQDEPPLTPSA